MARYWRSLTLFVLYGGPFAVYLYFGFLWLAEHGWWAVTVAGLVWVLTGVLATWLSARWTKRETSVLPPLDWDEPNTFAPRDKRAWEIIQEEASRGEDLSEEQLMTFDTYIDVGKRLARSLSTHYHPNAAGPLEGVPVVELLSSIELASEDLEKLCRSIPGGDLVTPGHWRKALKAADLLQKVNSVYSYISPVLNPVTGLTRLATREFLVKPSWQDARENAFKWFFEAYVNRLGVHLVELYSGRLAAGTEAYRRLSRISGEESGETQEVDSRPIVAMVAAETTEAAEKLAAALDASNRGAVHDSDGPEARLKFQPLSVSIAKSRAVKEAEQADLLIVFRGGSAGESASEDRFLRNWAKSFKDRSERDRPPALLVREREEALDGVTEDELGLGLARACGTIENPEPILRAIEPLLLRADKCSLLRLLSETHSRSVTLRWAGAIGKGGRALWKQWRNARGATPEKQGRPPQGV